MNFEKEWQFIQQKLAKLKGRKISNLNNLIFNMQILLTAIQSVKNTREKNLLKDFYENQKEKLCQYQIIKK